MRFAAILMPVVLVPVTLLGATEATKSPIVTTDLLKIRRVTEVEVAHDGSFAVYGVQDIYSQPPADTKANPAAEPADSYRTHLFLIDLNSSAAKPGQLTFGDRSDARLPLSPDGTRLAFTRVDAANRERPRAQVWIMPVRGWGEAQVVTKLENCAG